MNTYKGVGHKKDLPVENNQQIYGDTDRMAEERGSEHLVIGNSQIRLRTDRIMNAR